MNECVGHEKELGYSNLQYSHVPKDDWSANEPYGLSKLLVVMFTRGLRLHKVANEYTTMINMDPGTVNTKLLLDGWGPCGIKPENSLETYHLATNE